MSFTNTSTMFKKALKGKYAIGAFNIDDLNGLRAVIKGLNNKQSPGIIAITSGSLNFIGIDHIEEVKSIIEKESLVPIALHLDHGKSVELCKQCVDLGFTSVMIDASSHDFEENIRQTKEVVEYAHKHNVTVEGELGAIAGIEDDVNVEDKYGQFTHPDQAVEFVEKTNIDSLAIAIGTAHGAYKFKEGQKPQLRFDILDEITSLLPDFPIVLHGASSVPKDSVDLLNQYGGNMKAAQGIPEEMLRLATTKGVAKINIASDLRIAFTAALRKSLHDEPAVFDYKIHIGKATEAITAAVEREIEQVLGSKGRALDFKN